jgi:DNA-binding NtrC family response regulator
VSYREDLIAFKKNYILQALETNHWNVMRTARDIKMHRNALYKMLEQLKLHKPIYNRQLKKRMTYFGVV